MARRTSGTRGSLKGFVFQPGVVDEELQIVPPEAKRLAHSGKVIAFEVIIQILTV